MLLILKCAATIIILGLLIAIPLVLMIEGYKKLKGTF